MISPLSQRLSTQVEFTMWPLFPAAFLDFNIFLWNGIKPLPADCWQRFWQSITKLKVEIRFQAHLLDAQTFLRNVALAEQSSQDEPWFESLKAAPSRCREDSESKSWRQFWSQFMRLAPFLAISWLKGRFESRSSEAAPDLMDQVDAVGPAPNVLVKLHRKDASFPSIWCVKACLLLAAIRHLVANREMFVVTEISHQLSHHFVVSLDRCRSRAVHDANHLIQRVEDSRRLSFLLAEGMSSPKSLDLSCSGSVIHPTGRA